MSPVTFGITSRERKLETVEIHVLEVHQLQCMLDLGDWVLLSVVESLCADEELLPLDSAHSNTLVYRLPHHNLIPMVSGTIDMAIPELQRFLEIVSGLVSGGQLGCGESNKWEGLVVGEFEKGHCPLLLGLLFGHQNDIEISYAFC